MRCWRASTRYLGLRTLVIATPVAALFTGSVYMNVSTTSALSLATGDALFGVPASSRPINLLVLVLLVGVIQLLAGLLKLGSLVRFVSKSVMVGFTTGIALLIILGQLDGLTGFDSYFKGMLLQAADTVLRWQQYDLPTLAVGLLTIGLIVGLNYTRLRKVSMAVALIIATIVTWLLGLDSVILVGETVSAGGDLARSIFGRLDDITVYFFGGGGDRHHRLGAGCWREPEFPEPGRQVPEHVTRLYRSGVGEHGDKPVAGHSRRRLHVGHGVGGGFGVAHAMGERVRRAADRAVGAGLHSVTLHLCQWRRWRGC